MEEKLKSNLKSGLALVFKCLS